MKKIILSLSVLLCGLQMEAQTEILNGGFENWNNDSAELPVSWFGFNIDTSLVFGMDTMEFSAISIVKVEDSHSGSYAAKLQVDTMMGNEMPAIMFYTGADVVVLDYFNIEDDFRVPVQSTEGVINSIYGYYKFFPANGDTAIFAIGYGDSLAEVEVPEYIYSDTITDTVATYTQFSLEVPAGISVDSFLLAINGGSNIGSYLILDDISIEENVGIIELENNQINVFQNLENGDIRLVSSEELNGLSVRLISMEGRTVWSDSMNGSEKIIAVDGLPKGIYLVQFGNGVNLESTQKIIIK